MRIGGDRLGTEHAFHVNGINNFHVYGEATNIFPGYSQATNNFHGCQLDWSRAEKNDSFVRQSSFKAVGMEEATDS
jgi:hypothetical protein